MSFALVSILAVLFLLMAFACFAEKSEWGFLFLIVFLSIVAWMSWSANGVWKLDREETLTVASIDNTQCVRYNTYDGEEKFVNLNDYFGKIISDDEKVVLKRYKDSISRGIWWYPKEELTLKPTNKELSRVD